MAEEKKEDNKEEIVIPDTEEFEEEEVVEEKEEEETPQEEPFEVKAREMGWVPKEEYRGDPDTWVDAKEFVGRAPLFDAIHQEKRKNEKLRSDIDKIKVFQKKIYDKAKEDAIKQLKQQYEEASQSSDIKTAIETKEEIERLEKETFEEKEEDKKEPSDQVPEENKKAYEKWIKDNKWYEEDEDMRLYATAYGYNILANNEGIEYTDLLNKVAERMREKFPDKFSTPSQKRTPAVSRPSTSKGSDNIKDPKKITIHHLPEEVKPVYRQMVKSSRNPGGPLEHDDFIKQYLDVGGELVK